MTQADRSVYNTLLKVNAASFADAVAESPPCDNDIDSANAKKAGVNMQASPSPDCFSGS